MEFRGPSVAAAEEAKAVRYLTKNLADPEQGKRDLEQLIKHLGPAVESYPEWHPLLTEPRKHRGDQASPRSLFPSFPGMDHTRNFVRGLITCPYSDAAADEIVKDANQINGLHAYPENP